MHHNYSRGRGLLSSLGIKESKVPVFLEPAAASVSKECFACILLLAQKALWHSSNIWFFFVLSLINSLPDRILAGSYNGMYFQGSHFITRRVGSVFPGGFGTMYTSGLTLVFEFPSLYS